MRSLPLAVLVFAMTATAAQAAEQLPDGSVRAVPARAGAPATLVWRAAFEQPPGAKLDSYNVRIARGYRFDPRAIGRTCSVARARAGTCPASSRLGGGQAVVSITDAAGTTREAPVAIEFFKTPRQRRGDVAGIVLAARDPEAQGAFNLIGRFVRLASGPYGLELRWTGTAAAFPADVTVQIKSVDVRFGASRTVRRRGRRVTRSLLTNPTRCPGAGWPFLISVVYTTGPIDYAASADCR